MRGLLAVVLHALERRWPEGSYVQQIQSLKSDTPLSLPAVTPGRVRHHRKRKALRLAKKVG